MDARSPWTPAFGEWVDSDFGAWSFRDNWSPAGAWSFDGECGRLRCVGQLRRHGPGTTTATAGPRPGHRPGCSGLNSSDGTPGPIHHSGEASLKVLTACCRHRPASSRTGHRLTEVGRPTATPGRGRGRRSGVVVPSPVSERPRCRRLPPTARRSPSHPPSTPTTRPRAAVA